jgi:hypothetical protein
VPVRRSGRHMRARKIVILVTGAALNRIRSLPIGSAPDLHRMLMSVIALTREVSTGVTIHAARMAQHRDDRLKSGGCTSVLRYVRLGSGIGMFGLRTGAECKQEGEQGVWDVSHLMPCRSHGPLRVVRRSHVLE